jgi:hypothetical protein
MSRREVVGLLNGTESFERITDVVADDRENPLLEVRASASCS